MIKFILVLSVYAVFVYFKRPSKYLFAVVERELNPTPKEQELRFYRRGHTYNAIEGLKGTHFFALAWAITIVLRLGIISSVMEAVFDMVSVHRRYRGKKRKAASSAAAASLTNTFSEVEDPRQRMLLKLEQANREGRLSSDDFGRAKHLLLRPRPPRSWWDTPGKELWRNWRAKKG